MVVELGGEPGDHRAVGDVQPVRADMAVDPGQFLGGGGIAGGGMDVPALRGILPDELQADAPVGAGDQDVGHGGVSPGGSAVVGRRDGAG